MEGLFKKVNLKTISENYFKILNDDWALLTAGKPDHFNFMTVSWGSVGILWNRPVLFCFVRPQRYTFDFMNKNHYFTLSFFDPGYKEVLDYCGTHSGRSSNKIKTTGLTPYPTELGNVIFEQVRLSFECKKIYADDIKPGSIIDLSIIGSTYRNNDYHRMYIGEIVNCFKPY